MHLFPRITLLLLLLGIVGPAPMPVAHSAPSAAFRGGASEGGASESADSIRPADPGCGYSSAVADLLSQTSQEAWAGWIKKLSGAEPVSVGGNVVTITSRYSPYLFGYSVSSPAYDFVRQQVAAWYPGQVQDQEYAAPFAGQTWKNLVLTIPGTQYPEKVIILSAHLDSTASPATAAPGADDNATGSATLLEAARILQGHPLPATLRIIWFTGEEQGLKGSAAYAASSQNLAGVIGVINLDMFGYDGNGDRCVELHVGTLAVSDRIGSCYLQAAAVYQPDLTIGYITSGATSGSDHASFWPHQVGAIEILENWNQNDYLSTGCHGTDDWNPYYHSARDTFANITLPYSYDVARASLAAAFSLASLHYFSLPIIFN